MKKYCAKCSTLIGNYYHFYLSNQGLLKDNSFYIYQLGSPGFADEHLHPVLTLNKVAERTRDNEFSADWMKMNDSDLLATLLKSREDISHKGAEYIANLLRRENPTVYGTSKDSKHDFPLIAMGIDNSIQKSLIINLRNEIRWNNYRFFPGRQIDMLFTKDTFMVLKIQGDENYVWFTPENIYRNTDIGQTTPLKLDYSKYDYPREKFPGSKNKVYEINRTLKRFEWQSFDRKIKF